MGLRVFLLLMFSISSQSNTETSLWGEAEDVASECLNELSCLEQPCYNQTSTESGLDYEYSCLQLSAPYSTVKTSRKAAGMIIVYCLLLIGNRNASDDVINLTAGEVCLLDSFETTTFVPHMAGVASYQDKGLRMSRLRFFMTIYAATYLKRVPKLSLQAAFIKTHLLYNFFSMIGGVTIPTMDNAVKLEKRKKTKAGIFHIPLHGSPNKGYCAMIAIGTVNVQKVICFTIVNYISAS